MRCLVCFLLLAAAHVPANAQDACSEHTSVLDEISCLELKLTRQQQALDSLTRQMEKMDRRLCRRLGGAWLNDKCSAFMGATEGAVPATGRWAQCKAELGGDYVPCNAFQALALSGLYKIPNQQYYWLHAGGTAGQASVQTLWRGTHSSVPIAVQPNCPADHTVSFFHSWDTNHVDSIGCLQNSRELSVVCCRVR